MTILAHFALKSKKICFIPMAYCA